MGKMPLPQYDQKKHRIPKAKLCKECGKEFFGFGPAKYCEVHSNPRLRKKKRREFEDPSVRNTVFHHKFIVPTDIEFHCALKGCNKPFIVKVYPKQTVYPKYCEEHKVEFKRIQFLRKKNGQHHNTNT